MSFKTVNPKINAYAQTSAQNNADMVMLVVLSIQQPWFAVGEQMRDYREHGAASRFVWGNKRKTFDWLQEHKETLYRDAMDAKNDAELMEAFLQVPGLGLAKAGFCCQLFAGRVGCIDVHNLRRLNIAPSVLTFDKSATQTTKRKKIDAYVSACKQRRTSWLWDTWCKLIASKDSKRWIDANHVSAVHYDYLVR
ncbi:MAG: hypothetical protein VW270_01660 [Candidatus Poseidoniales archaeon]